MSQFFQKLFGDSPSRVFVRLLIFSLIVGIILSIFNITPIGIFQGIWAFIQSLWNRGFSALWKILDYVLVGAAIVVPVWIVIRLLNWKKN